ncbi:MAG: TolC family outer membrane protein [Burkholderiales bacterium]|nr:TolC family outer membrane protein [Burkholderiales bacterium]
MKKNETRRLGRTWTACLVAAALWPGAPHAQSLLEAYQLARENDPKFRAAQADFRAVSTLIDQARAGYLPAARLEFERMETRQKIISSQNPIFGAGTTTFPTFTRTLSVTQPVFRKDVIERMGQARSVVKQAEYTLLASEQELLLRTTAAYLVLLAATDSLALATAEREAVGKALDLARERLRAGLGTIVNQYDAQARYAVTQAREIEAQNRLRDARQALREITSKHFDKVQSLKDDFALETPQPAAIDRWLEAAFNQNLGLNARRESVEVARQEIERQKAGHYPSLNLLLQNNRKDTGSTLFGGGSNVDTTELSLKLSVPIIDGGLTRAVTQEAAHRYTKAQEELEQERRTVDRATRAYYEGVVAGVGLVDALKQSVIAQERALESKEIGHKSGLITLLPVLDAQRDLYLARRDYAQARYDYLVNRLRLQQVTGSLSELDLVSVNAALK